MSENNLSGRTLRYVKLQTGLFISEFGNIGDLLPPLGKTLNMQILYTEPGVYININNKAVEAVVPWANVQVAVFKKENLASVTFINPPTPTAPPVPTA